MSLKYTTEEAMHEIMCRSKQVILQRCHRTCRILSGVVSALSVILVLVISALPKQSAVPSTDSVYGSFLLSQEAGGYVLTAVIAFVLGVAVVLLCLHWRQLKQKTAERDKGNQQ